MGEHLDPRQDFLRLIRGWSCPFWAVHWKWRICCRTNWWPTGGHGATWSFFCCWKEQTNNEIRTNKIEEAKETTKKYEERLGVQIFKGPWFLAFISSVQLTTPFWLPGATTSGADGILEVSPSQKLTTKNIWKTCSSGRCVDARHLLPPSGPWG